MLDKARLGVEDKAVRREGHEGKDDGADARITPASEGPVWVCRACDTVFPTGHMPGNRCPLCGAKPLPLTGGEE